VTTRYTQDLAAPLSQVLQTKVGSADRTDYIYGLNRLASLNSGVKTWYAADALGSVRRTVTNAGGTRSIPAFVSEWIVTRNTPEGVLDATAQQSIRTFLNKHLPTRDQKEQLKAQLQNGEALTILDQFSITVDLQRNENRLNIPCLDERKAGVERHIIESFPLLLGAGVWGVGKLQYYPPDGARKEGQIGWLTSGQCKMHDWISIFTASVGLSLPSMSGAIS
jgi:hypothetical protein